MSFEEYPDTREILGITVPTEGYERSCPACGSTTVSTHNKRLSSLGYTHTDVTHNCVDCGAGWTHGHPRGDTGIPAPECPVCGFMMLVHKMTTIGGPGRYGEIQFKCPMCFAWFKSGHDLAPKVPTRAGNGEAIIGYPSTTGEVQL